VQALKDAFGGQAAAVGVHGGTQARHGSPVASTGTVRITISVVAASDLLPALLAALQHEEPGIALALVASNQVSNLMRREADITVRMLRPAQTGEVIP
jgi:DNA-binding transcriptional LysR family regulator